MPNYCVDYNARGSGDHEVHDLSEGARLECLPAAWNQRSVGWHPDCTAAVEAARSYYDQVNGCQYCCPAGNTT